MKSQVNGLLTVSLGILMDLQVAYPSYGKVSKDIERLTHMSKVRGLGFYSLDLPNLDSILLKGLESGRLIPIGALTTRVSKRIKVPRLFSGLWLRIFDNDCVLKPDADPTAIAFLRQLCCLGKKMVASCTHERIKDTINEYHSIESGLRKPESFWDEDDFDCRSLRSVHFCDSMDSHLPLFPSDSSEANSGRDIKAILGKFQRFCDEFSEHLAFFEPVSESQSRYENGVGIGFKHGPGAVSDRNIGSDPNKYRFLNWPDKLQSLFPFEECGIFNSANSYSVGKHESPSKLICVPKSAKAPRLIAAEPTQYMWTQMLVKDFLEKQIYSVLKRKVINFRDQNRSRILTESASRTGHLCTVDLSSASDRLSCWVVERAFRKAPSLLWALHATRTRWTVDRISDPPVYFRKRKFASQGTAVTFPVQTIIYALAALSVLEAPTLRKAIRRYGQEVQVFGDDIIMPKTGYADLCSLLDALQLVVNKDKSYVNGHFRESCGADYFRGYDVTPVKPQSISVNGPQLRASLVDFSNNLFLKGFWNAAKAAESIAGFLPYFRNLPVLGRSCEGHGLTCFSGTSISHLKTRWNVDLQIEEVRVTSLRARSHKKQTDDISQLFQFITEAPTPDIIWSSGFAGRPKCSDTLRWASVHQFL
uniref:RNA-directed RNA polymerase n=1 Tax=Grapevine-associated levi-like virus 3 TaxID=2814358 RepID=A0A8F5RB51_9VIRU|nr:MAG: RNA-dependent RNA polymerase [Grapevine-associated levi-like virus 3]